ncbi:MAG: maltose ABC transporter permease MalF [Hyphomicrobiales bacterium]|nr:MAG: maltose ABC transporter permease MalF [Hyphomicrobiales bacterium]
MSDIALRSEPVARPRDFRWLGITIVLLLTAACLYAVWTLYIMGQPLLAMLILVLVVAFAIIFTQRRFYASRFIFPGVAALLIFTAFPVVYTIYIGFTNYSFLNLLSYERAREVLLSRSVIDSESERPFGLVSQNGQYQLFLPEAAGGLLSDPFALDGTAVEVAANPVEAAPETLAMRDLVPLRANLGLVTVTIPDGKSLKLSGLRTFAAITPEYELQDDGRLVSTLDGSTLTPDQSVGFYRDDAGKTVPPGWAVNIGTGNFEKVFNSAGIRAPLFAIFIWTVSFAFLSVTLTFALGLLLAMVLQWPHLRFKPLYRLLLILPYSVPAFISILIFKGLFNQNYGEINLILKFLFGIAPEWNTDAWLARSMIVIVNVWLGYPYMMLLAMGFLQAVPADHAKAAALEGAGPIRVFFSITLPQILPPFLPLLIASFAFNFNNLVLVLLLTRGLPDMIGTVVPAGHTDILASFTYRISFLDSGQQFGLSGAISLVIFVIVTVIAYANFVAVRRAAAKGGTT